MVLKIKDYEPVRVHHGKGSEIGLYKKGDEYIIYRHAARGKIKNFVGNYEFIDNNNVSHLKPIDEGDSELFKALTLISKTGQGPERQHPSMGCNIKWIK